MLVALLRDQPKEAAKLLEYAEKLGVGAVYKRLGYLLQRDHPGSVELIEACRQRITSGYSKLDPALPADRLVTAWRVWIPESELRETTP
jgi:predicted transcriptional regulator of viral defense system